MLLRVLNCIPKDLACPSDTLLISMGIHPQSDSFVGVAQLFRYTGNVRAVGDGDAGKAVPKLVRVQTLDTIFPCKVLQITGRTLGMYRLGTAFLGEYILADGFLALLKPKLTQQCNDLRVHINGAVSTILRGIQIDALVRGITEVATDGDGVLCKVHILPLQSAAFAPADSGVDQQTDHCPPFQWLLG